MAKHFSTPIDLGQLEIRNAAAHNLAAAPASPVLGQFYYDTSTSPGFLYWWDGTTWQSAKGGAVSYGTPGSSAVGDAAAAGSASTAARSDHVHGREAFGAPASSAVGDTTANGTATTVARSDHKHAREAFGAVSAQTAFGASSANGTATTLAHSDHTHGTPTHDAAAHSTIAISALAAAAADVSLGGNKVTNLGTPTASTDAVTKAYADALAQGLSVKAPVRVATTANGTLATAYANGQTVDGVTLATGDRILVKNQTTASENGVYIVAASGAPARATDADASGELQLGTMTYVTSGTANGGQQWVISAVGATPWVPGSTTTTWVMYFAATATQAGAGLTATGNVLAVGAGTGITVAADTVAVDTSVVARHVSATVGDGATTLFTITHNLGNKYPAVTAWNISSGESEEVSVGAVDTNSLTVGFAVAPATNSYLVSVVG
jgi:hypothetical protein